MANRTDREVVEAIEQNRFQAFASFGLTPHGSVRDEREMLRVFTEIAAFSPLCGWIFRAQLAEDGVAGKIDEAVSAFDARELPVIWNTGPSTRPADLETHLLDYGFAPLFELAGMAADLEALALGGDAPAGVEIRPAVDAETLQQWADTFAAGFNVPGNVQGAIYRLFSSLVRDPDIPWHLFLALLDGAPVATSAMYLGAGVAGIYFVTTIPEVRRRGIGSASTSVALRKGMDAGRKTAVLHASPMAVSMYRSLGFQVYCRMGLFGWRPGA